MAYKNTIEKEHAFRLIEQDIKNDRLKNILLFYGEERYLINWAVNTITDKYLNDICRELNFSKLEGNSVTVDEIKNNCETLPVMSDYRIILIVDYNLQDGKKSKGIKEDDEKQLIDYFQEIPKSSLLILTADNVDKRKKLYKAISEYGGAYDFTRLNEKLLKAFLIKKLKETGKVVKSEIIEEMVNISGYYDKDSDYTLYHFENDIKKVVAHNTGTEINLSDIACLISGNINTDIFAMIDSLSKDNKAEALQFLHNLLTGGESEYKILALICSQFELIIMLKEMKEEGKNFSEIVKLMGIHEYRIKKAAMYTERYSIKQLHKILMKAYEIDKSIKTGLLEPSFALEIFISEI